MFLLLQDLFSEKYCTTLNTQLFCNYNNGKSKFLWSELFYSAPFCQVKKMQLLSNEHPLPPHPMHHTYFLNPRQLTDISTKMKVKQSLLAWLGGIWCKVHSLGFGLWFVKKCRTLSSPLSAHLWLQLTGQNVAQQGQTINYCTVEQEETGSV